MTALVRATELRKDFYVRGRGLWGRKRAVTAVDGVTFDIPSGQTLALVGESGSGKSTVARLVAKLLEPSGGRLEFDGADVTSLDRSALAGYRGEVQMVFQDPFSSLNPRHTVERILTAPLLYQGRSPGRDTRALAGELMERVGLDPAHCTRYPHQFSGGQAQRIGIARALVVEPKLVICDEAVSALDVTVQAQILDLLRDLQREHGHSYLFITHDLAVVRELAHEVVVMNKGRIVETGPCDQIFTEPRDSYTRTLLSAIPRIDPAWTAARRRNQPA